jgi:AcrR family transcriptional regulator
MKRNNKARPGEVRERILAEAVRLFGERGFEGAALQDVADAVGVRKPSLLHYFPSKEALRAAVIDELLAHWTRELPRLLSEATGGYKRFAATIEAVVEFFMADANRARLALRELLDRPREVQPLVAERLRPWVTLLTNYIRLGQQTGQIKPDVDPESYLIQVMMMAIGTVAVGPVIAGVVLENPAAQEPNVAELVRIAREALFMPPPAKRVKRAAVRQRG